MKIYHNSNYKGISILGLEIIINPYYSFIDLLGYRIVEKYDNLTFIGPFVV